MNEAQLEHEIFSSKPIDDQPSSAVDRYMLISQKASPKVPTTYRQCTRCVMDTSDPEITFDEAGRCNHCSEYLQIRSRRGYQGKPSDERLERLISEVSRAGRHSQYDCVIGVSGGAD